MKNKNKSKEQNKTVSASGSEKSFGGAKDYSIWFLGFALLLTLIGYIPAFSAGFVEWDDQDYVSKNQIIRSFSDFGKFFTTIIQGNFHPLTMISLAINYAISGENPFSYHLFNVILHLINVFLVYRFVMKLTGNNAFVAFTTAILFGIHPMHVESVAWISERKDVLYTVFFLPGLISYINYVDQNSRKHYIYTFIWFALSLLSKPAAIIFPAVLFTLDFYRQRKLTGSLIVEKLPFLAFSVILVLVTMHQQKAAGATPLTEVYGYAKRIYFPFYGYMMYFVKMIWPFSLSAFYPFPPINEELSNAFKFSPLFFIATALLCLKTWRTQREITFGFGFYFVNLLLVLQLFMFGSAIISDRYTYIPYIGLFFLIGWLMDKVLKLKTSTAYSIICGISILLCFLCYRQAASWHSTATLWDHAIKYFPSAKALTNRAYLYQKEGVFDKAIEYYNRSLKLNVIDKEVFFNLGLIYFNQNLDSLAIAHYNKALELKPDYVDALNGRGAVYARQGKNDLARIDFDKVKEIDPNYDQAYKNKAAAYFQEKNYAMAIETYKEYLKIRPKDAEAYGNLCATYLNKGDNQEAITACEEAIKLDPKYKGAYMNLGTAYVNLKQYQAALPPLTKSFELDSTNEENLKFLSLCYINMGDTAKAYSFFEMAERMRAMKK
jgi:tetratricopeptide (TPR) repeat protein